MRRGRREKVTAENEGSQKYRKVFETGDGDAQLECTLSLETNPTSATLGRRDVSQSGDGATAAHKVPSDGDSAESSGRAGSDGDHGAKKIVKSVVNAAGEERRSELPVSTATKPVEKRTALVEPSDDVQLANDGVWTVSPIGSAAKKLAMIGEVSSWLETCAAEVRGNAGREMKGEVACDGSLREVRITIDEEQQLQDIERAKILRVRAQETVMVLAPNETKEVNRRRRRKRRSGDASSTGLSTGPQSRGSGADTNGLEDGDAVGNVELPADRNGVDGQQAGVVVPSADEGGRSDEVAVSTEATLQVSRARRKHDKKIRKARAPEQQKLRAWLAMHQYPEDAYVAFEEMWRRQQGKKPKLKSGEEAVAPRHRQPCSTVMRTVKKKDVVKQYAYHSGSVYRPPNLEWVDGGARPARVGRVRAVQAQAMDSLPTARMQVGDEWRSVKLDTGAQYSVVGESWKELDEKQSKLPVVDFVEGFTGAVSRVIGVWKLQFHTQYGQAKSVEALMVEGAADEFLLGEDWMLEKGVKIDFTSWKMKWYSGDDKKIVPFSCEAGDQQPARVARVRLLRRQRVPMRTCRNVELAVEASEGTVGLDIPAPDVAPHLLLASTVTTVRGGNDERS
ncbi:hypothetical protein PHMEG_00034702 [Phytophthora megakarya]|uniref:Uncharacterized protein n=1 Tax=Phytophthora megakarya TaxID=4795 RepID=A0A225UQE5_9STRA|nr:hypothetical protein PHMEG_00034702 [Phytophthora megakarya]